MVSLLVCSLVSEKMNIMLPPTLISEKYISGNNVKKIEAKFAELDVSL